MARGMGGGGEHACTTLWPALHLQVVDSSADKDLIEMVERDILDSNPNVRLSPRTALCH